ncbi:MAG: YdcF family protein [Hyphomicrobiaceae bacterium]
MFYVLSKVLWILLQPSSVMLLAVLAGLIALLFPRTHRLGLRLAWAGTASLFIAGILPVGSLLLLPLEGRFPTITVPTESTRYSGIIVLGGAEEGRTSLARHQLQLNEAAERITEATSLARALPNVPLVFAGGVAFAIFGPGSGSEPVARWWTGLGIPTSRILTEDKSRNTYENAIYTRSLLPPVPGKHYLLVTSAAHMPRAMGVFRKAGYDVTAYPTDYRTRGTDDLFEPSINIPAGLMRLDAATREWIGLLVYWMAGRTSALFPGP